MIVWYVRNQYYFVRNSRFATAETTERTTGRSPLVSAVRANCEVALRGSDSFRSSELNLHAINDPSSHWVPWWRERDMAVFHCHCSEQSENNLYTKNNVLLWAFEVQISPH